MRNPFDDDERFQRQLLRCKSQHEKNILRFLSSMLVELEWESNQYVDGYEFDVVSQKAKIIVEIDGVDHLTEEHVIRRDRLKESVAAQNGYTLFRYSTSAVGRYEKKVATAEVVFSDLLAAIRSYQGRGDSEGDRYCAECGDFGDSCRCPKNLE